jgi:alkaline phosphatase
VVTLGGRCHFLPQDHPESCRSDDKDLLAQATERGFTYIPDRATFDSLTPSAHPNLPLMGLFSSGVHLAVSVTKTSTCPTPLIVSLNRNPHSPK